MKQANAINAVNSVPAFEWNAALPFAACATACVPFFAMPAANLHAIAFMHAQREVQEQERHARWVRRLEPSLN